MNKLTINLLISSMFFVMCSVQNNESVIHGTVSACGGFEKSLSKATIIQESTIVSFVNESLCWKYSSLNQTLDIIHTDCSSNCAAELAIDAVNKGDTIYLNEKDHRNDPGRTGGTESGCTCVFDLLVTIPNFSGSECTIVYQDKYYTFSPKDLSGSFGLNDSVAK